MSILSDKQIRELCVGTSFYDGDKKTPPMITPYSTGQVRINHKGERILSWGQGSYGYDVRVANKFKIFTNINTTVIDPLAFDDKNYVDFEGDCVIIPPNSFVLASTIEYFNIPADVTGIVLGKSTLARCGCSCLATPLEAGWSGELVLEFANTTPLPMKLYANQGCAQILFFKGDVPCEMSYASRNGKYQNQTGITLPRG